MLYTTALLSRGSFIGSLISKVRQVIKNTQNNGQQTITNKQNVSSNNLIPKLTLPFHASTTPITTSTALNALNASLNNRPITAANISQNSPALGKTLEEKIGLPPRPKKPLTPYFRYMREMRPKLIADDPKISTTDVVRKLSKSWSSVDPSLKQRLQEEYRKDQQSYVEQRIKYDAKLTEEQRAEIKQLKQDISEAKERKLLRKRVSELGRPKKPASAFLRFIAKERTDTPQTSQQTYRDWHQKATAKWSRLSDAEKDVYIQDARKELEKYKKAISAWEDKMIRLGHIDVVRHGNLIDPPEPKPRKSLNKEQQK